MNFALKMMYFVLKMMYFVLKMTNFGRESKALLMATGRGGPALKSKFERLQHETGGGNKRLPQRKQEIQARPDGYHRGLEAAAAAGALMETIACKVSFTNLIYQSLACISL